MVRAFKRHRTPYHWLLHTRFCDLVRWTFVIGAQLKTGFGKKMQRRDFSPYLACIDRNAFFTSEKPKNIMHGRVKMYVMR